jgi:hypothetical protein
VAQRPHFVHAGHHPWASVLLRGVSQGNCQQVRYCWGC